MTFSSKCNTERSAEGRGKQAVQFYQFQKYPDRVTPICVRCFLRNMLSDIERTRTCVVNSYSL